MKLEWRRAICLLCWPLMLQWVCSAARAEEINTVLMKSTFEILGQSTTAGKTNGGTVFVIGKPLPEDPKLSYSVLVTAAHVLEELSGDNAVLILRKKNDKGSFDKFPFPIKIRDRGVNLYVKNPRADVAAMYVNLPQEIDFHPVSTDILADDSRLEALEVHPGDELFCLGFPLFADSDGFPILRTGTLASYPITPSNVLEHYLFAFHVFPGNSGGPVYFYFANRAYGGGTHISIEQGVIGLVSQQMSSTLPEYKDLPLDVAKVVPSRYIRDTIALLPAKP